MWFSCCDKCYKEKDGKGTEAFGGGESQCWSGWGRLQRRKHLSQIFKEVCLSGNSIPVSRNSKAKDQGAWSCLGCSCSQNSKEARMTELEWVRTLVINELKKSREAFWVKKWYHSTENLKRNTLTTFLRVGWGRWSKEMSRRLLQNLDGR